MASTSQDPPARPRVRRRLAPRLSCPPAGCRSGMARPWRSRKSRSRSPATDHRPDRPFGLRQEHALRCFNRMNDLIAGARMEGEIRFDGDLISALGIDPVVASAANRHGVSETQSVPEEHLQQRRLGGEDQRLPGRHGRTGASDRSSARHSGTRSRTSSIARDWSSPAASSSGFALPGPWPSSPRSS